jgi:glycosyltransferase involved in cell wall biosynthesis
MSARATVIIPTYGEAYFAKWAVKSVQRQTVQDIEICIICDGSPSNMVEFFGEMAKEDSRIRVFPYPKSPRAGEPYRDEVIRQTTGRIICYCCHDDLWLPNYVETVEAALQNCSFVCSLQAIVNVPDKIVDEDSILSYIQFFDFHNPDEMNRMITEIYGFGLTYGAHTRNTYNKLKEGWVTTPAPGLTTDIYMWRKFARLEGEKFRSITKILALNLQKPARLDWTQEERYAELENYFVKLKDQQFLKFLEEYPAGYFGRKTKVFESNLRNIESCIRDWTEVANDWENVANERLNDILSKQRQIDALHLALAESRDKINQLILQSSLKRQTILFIKRVLPKPVSKGLVKIKRRLFGPEGIE